MHSLHSVMLFLLFQLLSYFVVGVEVVVVGDDDCCLCDDCEFVSNLGQPIQISTTQNNNTGTSATVATCEDISFNLLLYSKAKEETCHEHRELFRDLCCSASGTAHSMNDPSLIQDIAASAHHRRDLQFTSWKAPSTGSKTTYISWSSSGPISASSSFTNTLSQWASSLSNSFPSSSSNIFSFPRPSPPSPPTLFQFPRPSPPTRPSGSSFQFSPPTRPSGSSFQFPRPTPPTFNFPSPTPPTRPTLSSFTAPAGGSSGGASSKQWVDAHNNRRSKHHRQNGVSYVPVKWSNELAASANAYTQRLLNGLSGCQIRHKFQGDTFGGENLAMQITQSSSSISPDAVLRMWYEGEIGLPYPQNGHLTQVVWRGTKYVGCAVGTKRSGSGYCHIQTCRYLAPGNCNGAGNLLQASTSCGPQCPPREGCF